jgi:hypothetical protein
VRVLGWFFDSIAIGCSAFAFGFLIGSLLMLPEILIPFEA